MDFFCIFWEDGEEVGFNLSVRNRFIYKYLKAEVDPYLLTASGVDGLLQNMVAIDLANGSAKIFSYSC